MEQIALLWDPLAWLRILAQDSECMIDVRSKIASIFILGFALKWLRVTDKEYEVGRTGKGREGIGQEGIRCGESRKRKAEEEKEETAVGVSVEATPKSRLLRERTGVGVCEPKTPIRPGLTGTPREGGADRDRQAGFISQVIPVILSVAFSVCRVPPPPWISILGSGSRL